MLTGLRYARSLAIAFATFAGAFAVPNLVSALRRSLDPLMTVARLVDPLLAFGLVNLVFLAAIVGPLTLLLARRFLIGGVLPHCASAAVFAVLVRRDCTTKARIPRRDGWSLAIR